MSNLVYYKQEILTSLGEDRTSTNYPKYVTKIGIQAKEGTKIELNNQEYFIGKTGILEIEGWIITKIKIYHNETEIGETYNTYETISIDKPETGKEAEITYSDGINRTQKDNEKWELIIQTETTEHITTPINDQIIIDYCIETDDPKQDNINFFN